LILPHLQVYGEMTPEMVTVMLRKLGLREGKLFVDLGSGLSSFCAHLRQCNSVTVQETAG